MNIANASRTLYQIDWLLRLEVIDIAVDFVNYLVSAMTSTCLAMIFGWCSKFKLVLVNHLDDCFPLLVLNIIGS